MVLDGTGSVYDDTGWYLVSISWYCYVLGGTGSAKGLCACIYWKKWRFGQVLLMPDTQTDNRIYRATQLGYSIKFKLSHAIKTEKSLGERGEEQYSGSLSLTNMVQDIKGTINNISIKFAMFKRHFLVPYD